MPNAAILVEKTDRICTITMNRPEVMNAYNADIGIGLQEAFNDVASDEGTSVVILTGAGRNFTSGADMALLNQGAPPPERLQMMKAVSKLITTMRELPQPIICKVRGAAYGIGSNLVHAGDFVIASDDARICEVFVNIGVIMDGGGHYFLPRAVGLAKARELALLGEEISGKEAAEIGLIYKSVPEPDLDREAHALATKLAAKSRQAMALIKEGLEGSLNMTLKEVMEWEASHQSIMLQTQEHKDAVRSFLQSRKKAV
jgi:2-(1,2-epoxy-1,2-dihydrophenyl)acetyl-CoA isomerase